MDWSMLTEWGIDYVGSRIDGWVDYMVFAVLGYVVLLVKKYTGVTVSKKLQDDLHRAAVTGVTSAIRKGLKDNEAIIAHTLEHMGDSVGKAMRKLSPGDKVAENIILSKIEQYLPGEQQ